MSKEPVSAPYGWDVIGEDNRRVGRWLGKADADELATRIRAATDEKVKVVAADPRILNRESGLTEADVRSPVEEPAPAAETKADTKKK